MPDGAERRHAQRNAVRVTGKSDFVELDDYLRGEPKRASQTDLLVGDDDDDGACYCSRIPCACVAASFRFLRDPPGVISCFALSVQQTGMPQLTCRYFYPQMTLLETHQSRVTSDESC